MNRKLYLYLADDYIGELTVAQVRGRETWMFRYDDAYLGDSRPMIDPSTRETSSRTRHTTA